MILAFLAQLQNVLYMGILAMPSKIYIVINYKMMGVSWGFPKTATGNF